MAIDICLQTLYSSAGDSIGIPPVGLTILVGGNNVGKSRALVDVVNHITAESAQTTYVVDRVDLTRSGGDEDFVAWLDATARRLQQNGQEHYRKLWYTAHKPSLVGSWNRSSLPLGEAGRFIAHYLRTDERLGLLSGATVFDTLHDAPSHPLQSMYVDRSLEERLDGLVKEAFGFGVTLNRHGGTGIFLHAGNTEPATSQPPDTDYLERIRKMPLVSDQGDGVRSYTGLLLTVIAAKFPIIAVDEPEAFLHPPQARLLGRRLAEESTATGNQVLLATHSLDVLLGALDSPQSAVTVVRVTRTDDDRNPMFSLDADYLRATWANPLLRFSRILDALFHRGAIICEADSDCRFYQALLDARRADLGGLRLEEVLFTHCGGKDRVPAVIDALNALRIPCAVIADIDLLQSTAKLREIIEKLGGEWHEFETDLNVLNNHAANIGSWPVVSEVAAQVNALLAGNTEHKLTKPTSEAIANVIRVETGWKQLKVGGFAMLPGGAVHEAAMRIAARARALGLFVVPVGELERWAPSIGGHGPAWVAEALDGNVHSLPETDAAYTFAKGALEHVLTA